MLGCCKIKQLYGGRVFHHYDLWWNVRVNKNDKFESTIL